MWIGADNPMSFGQMLAPETICAGEQQVQRGLDQGGDPPLRR
jgi:hypothetical protein